MGKYQMSEHPLCTALRELTSRDLPPVQQAFDDYQQECFIERPPEFFALELTGEAGELTGEAGELANLVKKQWKDKEAGRQGDEATRRSNEIAEEAADVLIALMNFCNAQGVDLGPAVAEKLEKIKPSR